MNKENNPFGALEASLLGAAGGVTLAFAMNKPELMGVLGAILGKAMGEAVAELDKQSKEPKPIPDWALPESLRGKTAYDTTYTEVSNEKT